MALKCPVCGKETIVGWILYFYEPAYRSWSESLCVTCWKWASTYFTKLVRLYADNRFPCG